MNLNSKSQKDKYTRFIEFFKTNPFLYEIDSKKQAKRKKNLVKDLRFSFGRAPKIEAMRPRECKYLLCYTVGYNSKKKIQFRQGNLHPYNFTFVKLCDISIVIFSYLPNFREHCVWLHKNRQFHRRFLYWSITFFSLCSMQ